jgi:hypothetical protein
MESSAKRECLTNGCDAVDQERDQSHAKGLRVRWGVKISKSVSPGGLSPGISIRTAAQRGFERILLRDMVARWVIPGDI